jgi:hypothetical protein
MSAIKERIRSALSAGTLKQVPDCSGFARVDSMADLLKPWEEMFPGAELIGEEESRDVFDRGGLRRPKLTPRPRRSSRPLPAPRSIAASPRTVSPGLFTSVQGIWEFYQARKTADAGLLQLPFTDTGVNAFIQPLFKEVSDWYPLFIPLEMLFEEYALADLQHIHLMLPHYTYEDESAAVVEAFLTDADSVASLMEHYHSLSEFMELPQQDEQLIGQLGFEELVKGYEQYRGAKSCNLDQLLNGPDSFFDSLERNYPVQMKGGWPIISGNSGYDCDVTITCAQDIQFCLDYAAAYERMISAIPDPYDMETNECGTTEEFVHDLCEVWRKSNHKRSVKWTSPKQNLLKNLYTKGQL